MLVDRHLHCHLYEQSWHISVGRRLRHTSARALSDKYGITTDDDVCWLRLYDVFRTSDDDVWSLRLKKVKCAKLLLQFRRGAHLPSKGHEPVGGNTTIVCDAWPVRRQTYVHLPSRNSSPRICWYQVILLSDRGTCVLTTCPGLHSIAGRLGFELATYWSSSVLTTRPTSHIT